MRPGPFSYALQTLQLDNLAQGMPWRSGPIDVQ